MLKPSPLDPNYKEQMDAWKKDPHSFGFLLDESGKNTLPSDWKEVPLVIAPTDEKGLEAKLDAETAPEIKTKKIKG